MRPPDPVAITPNSADHPNPTTLTCPIALARHARRAGLITALRRQTTMPLTQLISLVLDGKYAAELGSIRLEELFSDSNVVRIEAEETTEDVIMRLFRGLEGQWLSSQFFARYLGLEPWTAQKICRDLAERGLILRRGATSGTGYCFDSPHETALSS